MTVAVRYRSALACPPGGCSRQAELMPADAGYLAAPAM